MLILTANKMKLILILLLVIIPEFVFSQSNYYEGYVVKNNGDTLKGYIDYRNWEYSPVSFNFKVKLTDNQIFEFRPEEVKSFQINGYEVYKTFAGNVSTNKNIFPNIPGNLDTSTIFKHIFLKPIATGNNITLFFNDEVYKDRFFIEEKNDLPMELKYYEYYSQVDNKTIIHELYKGQLKLYINKYNNGDINLLKQVESVKFEKSYLIEIVDKINKIAKAKENYSINKGNKKSYVRLFGGFAVNFTENNYIFSSGVYSTGALINPVDYNISTTIAKPSFNFGMDLFANPQIQQSIFRIEFSASFLNGNIYLPNTVGIFNNYMLNYHQSSITIIPQFIFNFFNKDKFKVYIDAGFAFNRSLYSNDKSDDLNNLPLTRDAVWGYFPFQLGTVLNKRFEFSYTYSSFYTYTNYSNVYVHNKLKSKLGFKYLFK